jgi:hypothetical protein
MNGVWTNSEVRRNNLRSDRVHFARDFQKGYVRKVVSGFFWMMEGDDPSGLANPAMQELR